jgi:hypothetical protein
MTEPSKPGFWKKLFTPKSGCCNVQVEENSDSGSADKQTDVFPSGCCGPRRTSPQDAGEKKEAKN